MSREQFAIDADALHAYADGQLGDAERAAVESFLETHPEAAREVTNWRRQNDALKALFGPVASEPVPSRLSPQKIAHQVRTGRWDMVRNIAAALIIVAAAGGAGWYLHGALQQGDTVPDRLIADALVAHTLYVKEQTHAVEVAADSPNLMRWLSNRIATQIDAPDLSGQGYKFLGGRLLPGDDSGSTPGPAAQLMYENAAAERVTLYITAALPDKKTVWKFEDRNGVEAYYWANDAVTCTIVAELPEADVRALGKKVFEQLTRRPDSSWES
jgi:anti-sigma factor RsiW